MKAELTLPTGETIDLFSDHITGMEYACAVGGHFKTSVADLVEEHRAEREPLRRLTLEDEMRDMAYYYAAFILDFDKDLSHLTNIYELGEKIYLTLLNS